MAKGARRSIPTILGLGLAPLIYFHHLILPLPATFMVIGNDFHALYYKYKVVLLSHLADFSLPLWSPSEAAGYPFLANPFAQALYPLNAPLLAWFGLAGGYSVTAHQFFSVSALSIFAVGLFLWLGRLGLARKAAFISTVVMTLSFKTTEILRFPNAVHAAAWYPWLLYAVTLIFTVETTGRLIMSATLLAAGLICLVTAGYPYYAYYLQFLIIPYGLIFIQPSLRRSLLGETTPGIKKPMLALAGASAVAAAATAPYLMLIKNLMSQTADRTGADFNYSSSHEFNLVDSAASLIYPPAAQAEGWYFFSIAALLLIILFAFRALRPPEAGVHTATKHHARRAGLLYLFAWMVFITAITYGRDSWFFSLLWGIWPGFSSLRAWGRLNIVLVPIIAWLLAMALEDFETVLNARGKAPRRAAAMLAAAYSIILAGQLAFNAGGVYDHYWTSYFKPFFGAFEDDFIWAGAGSFFLILLMLLAGRKLPRRISGIAVMAMALVELWPVGAHQWMYKLDSPLFHAPARINPDSDYRQSLDFLRTARPETISITPEFNTGVIANWYFRRYVDFLERSESESGNRDLLLGVAVGQRIFFSSSLSYSTVGSFLDDARRFTAVGRLVSYTGDELVWEINAPAGGYLSFIDNWDPSWRVEVDGRQGEIELLFGCFKSVRLEKGPHSVRFTYHLFKP